MPDDNDDIDDDPEGQPNPVRQQRERIKTLERELAESREAANKTAALERKLMFSEAGLADHPMRDYLVDGYKGEMTKEAIQAEAARLGIPLGGATPPPGQQQQTRKPDIDANADMDEALGGGDGGGEEFAVYQRELDECDGDPKKIDKVMAKYQHRVRLLTDID